MACAYRIIVIAFLSLLAAANGALVNDFYRSTCPQAASIVRQITWNAVRSNPALAAKLLRLHFHDCFVQGCDGSVLLDPVNGVPAEKDARPNLSLAGFDVIDQIKTAVEKACPNVVSCADILALSARDAVSMPFKVSLWKVPTGRRDGMKSLATDTVGNLPSPFAGFSQLAKMFNDKGLSNTDMVVLSGAHTLGVAHCGTFSSRLYNFSGRGDTDPSLDPTYAASLKAKCPNPSNPSTTVELDPQSSDSFDGHYYKTLVQKKGLLTSDATLLTNPSAAATVRQLRSNSVFFNRFAASMVKMGRIGTLTGTSGQIRTNCRVIN